MRKYPVMIKATDNSKLSTIKKERKDICEPSPPPPPTNKMKVNSREKKVNKTMTMNN